MLSGKLGVIEESGTDQNCPTSLPLLSHHSKGNRCGHNPNGPTLAPPRPIKKGVGGLPRILSLAAERAKEWYAHPKKCPPLQAHPHRKTRSERREACQIIIETILSHLDLASLCLGTPTLDAGFIDIDMRTIVRDSGMGQRRCERAIALLKRAGFMKVEQPRRINDHGDYVGLRAIRVVTELFFEYLNLGPMLQRERARATARLQRRAAIVHRRLSDFMRRLTKVARKPFAPPACDIPSAQQMQPDLLRQWNQLSLKYMLENIDPAECRRRTNEELGLPADFSPGKLS